MARRLVVAVVAHPARVAAADQLAAFLGAEVFLDSAGLGAWGNHARALAWAAEQDASHVIVVQDDAEPVPRFLELAAGAIERRPVGPIGFYVGRNRPRAAQVERAVRAAEQLRASWLDADSLLWGVATALPVGDLPALLEWAPSSELPYDARVGRWYRQKGTRVRYTWPSLVDHADWPSVIPDRPRLQPRKAWKVGEPASWDGPVVRIGL